MDPKLDLDNSHVTIEECNLLFGSAKKFKIKSPTLKLVNKVVVEDIYWRVFGMSIVTNNEMPTWIMCGIITQSNVNQINWAKATESIGKEKACKDEVRTCDHLLSMEKEMPTNSGGSLNLSSLNPNGEPLRSQLQPTKPGLEDVDVATHVAVIEECLQFLQHTKYPTSVLVEDITKVTKLLELKKELHKVCKVKIKSLKSKHGVVSNKLLGMKSNMDDMKHVMEEAQVDFAKAK